MANKNSIQLATSHLNILLSLISMTVLSLSMGYAPDVALAHPTPEFIQVDTAGGLPTARYLPHECEAYPLALPEDSINGLQSGATFEIFYGSSSGNYRWVYWNPEIASPNTVSYLLTELQNPALSLNDFTDVFDSNDHSLNSGDEIRVSAGEILNAYAITDEMENLIYNETTMRVAVVDNVSGTGSTASGHIANFILVKINDYSASPIQGSTFTYLGPAEDPEVCRQFGLSLTSSPSQTGWPGQVLTYAHNLSNQGNYTETALLTYSTSILGWSVDSGLISQTLASGQVVTFTTAVTIPDNSSTGITQTMRITATLFSSPTVSVTVFDNAIIVNKLQVFLPVILKQ